VHSAATCATAGSGQGPKAVSSRGTSGCGRRSRQPSPGTIVVSRVGPNLFSSTVRPAFRVIWTCISTAIFAALCVVSPFVLGLDCQRRVRICRRGDSASSSSANMKCSRPWLRCALADCSCAYLIASQASVGLPLDVGDDGRGRAPRHARGQISIEVVGVVSAGIVVWICRAASVASPDFVHDPRIFRAAPAS
jgi:hypothetical protein